MMHSVIRALADYLAAFELPLYLADAVPQGLAFPYLTAAVSAAFSPDKQGGITLTLWCAGGTANTARLTLHNTLLQRLPARGICLDTAEGRYILRPGSARCIRDGEAIGIETALEIRCFPGVQGG